MSQTSQVSLLFNAKKQKSDSVSERVVLGHFHERVGESPGQYENFGASRNKKSLFVTV